MNRRANAPVIAKANPRLHADAGQAAGALAGDRGLSGLYRRLAAALLAGLLAIFLNMALLAVADRLDLPTAHGGLLRLLLRLSGGSIRVPAGPLFQASFHILVGMGMAVFYAVVLEPVLTRMQGQDRLLGRSASWQGLIYAAVVWIANAAVVLPLTGEGFAGNRHLSLAGMLWFAAAHTLFFLALAVFYRAFRRSLPGDRGGQGIGR